MKKRVLLLIMCIGIIILSACGKSNLENDDITNNNINQNENNSSNNNNQTNETNILLDGGTFKVPAKEIYIDYPNFNTIESGYTRLYRDSNLKYIAFTYNKKAVTEDAKEAFDLTYDIFTACVDSYHVINSIVEIDGENITVNNIDTYKFKGVLSTGTNPVYDVYMYGYSFVLEDVPCLLLGIVQDESQPQAEIESVTEIVDAMMKTVRNEP